MARKQYTLNDKGLPVGEALYYMPGSPFIWAKPVIDGKPYPFSTKETDWRKALERRDERKAELLKEDGSAKRNFKKVTIGELCEDYLAHLEVKAAERGDYAPDTAYIYRKVIEANVYRLFGGKGTRAASITTKMIESYRATRLQEKTRKGTLVTPHTVDKEFVILRSAMNYGAESRPPTFDKSLIPDFQIDKANATAGTKTGTITLEQFQTLLPHMPEWMRPIFAVCYFTGIRKREARFVRRSQVNWATGLITLQAMSTKSKKERQVAPPTAYGVWDTLQAWEKQTAALHPKCTYLFHLNGEQIASETLDDTFDRACLAADFAHFKKDPEGDKFVRDRQRRKIIVKDIHWHDSRRTFVTMTGNFEGVNDTDRGRVAGQTAPTRDRYDQNNSAFKIRDAFDKELAAPAPMPVAPAPAMSVDVLDQLERLVGMFDRNILTADEFSILKGRLIAS